MARPFNLDTESMHRAPRCGARTRSGAPCQAPKVSGKVRCRMHGGAPGSGAPKGNQNAFKTGCHTASANEMRRRVMEIQRTTREILDQLVDPDLDPLPASGRIPSSTET